MSEEKLSMEELELRIKEQDLKLKQAEVRAKERDLKSSRWFSPVVIGLFAAALGLIGNVIVTTINSRNTQQLERFRNQSSLILEAINTNGDANAACRNLLFFVSLDLLDDKEHTITGACPGNVQGIPAVWLGPADHFAGIDWYPLRLHTIDASGTPLPNTKVEVNIIPPENIEIPSFWEGAVQTNFYLGTAFHTRTACTTDKTGSCFLGMAPSDRFLAIVAQKSDYTGTRMNIFFRGTSVDVMLQKHHT